MTSVIISMILLFVIICAHWFKERELKKAGKKGVPGIPGSRKPSKKQGSIGVRRSAGKKGSDFLFKN